MIGAGDARGFGGAKVGIIVGDAVLALLRDDDRAIPHPGLWDLPGGGREGAETPLQTARRELHEELGLRLDPCRVAWRRHCRTGGGTWFFGAYWPGLDPGLVRFGGEGQGWALMPVDVFLRRDDAVPHLQARLRDFLTRQGAASSA